MSKAKGIDVTRHISSLSSSLQSFCLSLVIKRTSIPKKPETNQSTASVKSTSTAFAIHWTLHLDIVLFIKKWTMIPNRAVQRILPKEPPGNTSQSNVFFDDQPF